MNGDEKAAKDLDTLLEVVTSRLSDRIVASVLSKIADLAKAAENGNGKKNRRGWPKGKPRGPRNGNGNGNGGNGNGVKVEPKLPEVSEEDEDETEEDEEDELADLPEGAIVTEADPPTIRCNLDMGKGHRCTRLFVTANAVRLHREKDHKEAAA